MHAPFDKFPFVLCVEKCAVDNALLLYIVKDIPRLCPFKKLVDGIIVFFLRVDKGLRKGDKVEVVFIVDFEGSNDLGQLVWKIRNDVGVDFVASLVLVLIRVVAEKPKPTVHSCTFSRSGFGFLANDGGLLGVKAGGDGRRSAFSGLETASC